MSRIRQVTREYWFELLIGALTVAGIAELVVSPGSPTSRWFAVPALALLMLPLFTRRWFPFGAPAAYWILAPALSFVDGLLIPSVESFFLVGLASAALLGNLRNARHAWIGLAIVLAGITAVVYNIPGRTTAELILIPIEFGIAWAAGYALRMRGEQVEAAETRAARAEREREAAARVAVAEERARIARELHDIVAHAMSVMVLQVGAVRHKLPPGREEDRDALGRVERAGRTALAEMRRLLGAMRRDGDGLDLAPQPGLDGLDSLLEDVGRAGLPARLHVEGEPFELPRAIDLSAYRIVQEGLTNSLKHANATRADVTVRYRDDELAVEVVDDGAGAATTDGLGHGLVGHSRARQDLRRRDERKHRTRGRLRPQRPPPARPVPGMSLRVLVADDQSMVRAGFRMLLAEEPDIEVVAEASNGREAVDKAARFEPTVVLMDIRMPELDGLEATRRILAANDGARVLILTTFDLDEYVYEALRAGASGFVLKDDPPEQLLEAIRVVAGGDALLSPSITKRVIKQFTRIPRVEPPEQLEELTEREVDVFRLVARGLSNAEIGKELYISEATVKTHITHILQKLDLRDRVQAVVLAYETGLFDGDKPAA